MKQDLLKEAYRRWFSQLNEQAPEDVWERIEDELDLDEVWKGIDANLPATRSLIPWKRIAGAAAVLLFLAAGFAAYRYISRQYPPDGRASLAKAPAGEMIRPGEAPAGEEVSPEEEVPSEEEVPVRGQNSTTSGISPQPEGSGAGGRDAGYSAAIRPVEAFAANMAALPPLRIIPHVPATGIVPAARLPEVLPPRGLLAGAQPGGSDMEAMAPEKPPFVKVYRLGMASSYNNTWMLNHETFTGLRPSTLDATTATYGISTGINAAFLLNGRHRVGTELYFSSRSGQRYRQYIQARYLSRSIELDYFKLQLYYYLPVFSGKADVLAGGYLSYLKRGREEIGGEARAVGQFYRNEDYGLLTGLQFNLPVSAALELHPGIRINYGLPNIFKGDQLVPEDFLRTHNASLGLHLGVSYKLSR